MHWRNTLLGSSSLLSVALFATMVYSLARLLGATIASDGPAELTDVPVATQAIAFGAVDRASTVPDGAAGDAEDGGATDSASALTQAPTDAPPRQNPTSAFSTPTVTAPAAPGDSTATTANPVTTQDSPSASNASTVPTIAPSAQPSTSPSTPATPVPSPTARPGFNSSASGASLSSGGGVAQAAVPPTATPQPRLTASSRGVESVRFVKEVDDHTFIVFRGNDLWLVDHDATCFGTQDIGSTVLIYSPGSFPDSANRIVLPSRPRDCPITDVSPI